MGFPSFTKTHFGGFTFEMANEVFRQAFQEPRMIEQQVHNSPEMQQQLAVYNPAKKYVPPNSTIVGEKTIERNGKRILVTKYSIRNSDGTSRT